VGSSSDTDAALTAAVGAVVILGGLLLLILIVAALRGRGRRARQPAYAGMPPSAAPLHPMYQAPAYQAPAHQQPMPQPMPPPMHAPPVPGPTGPPPGYSPSATPAGPPPGPTGPPPGPTGPTRGPSGPPPGPSVAAASAPGRWGYVDEPLALFDSRRTHIGALQPGSWYEVLDEQAGWTNVRLPDRSTGWVDARRLKRNP